ncbi:mediator of RNA polymerase II transcription subunit 29-like [Saccoglossus kowalevskii]|uniref:Mediator of RNA polymerase II transcription subunit 29 n=1 Tax=Saccoglossus kowalevskii TaxID=10224 RepID=A0ABM0GV38_SACKO|nr:PREDICTED: mediator of RNA polymerase II transcription subunit 29-like [Saccoglossus kowalevskii]
MAGVQQQQMQGVQSIPVPQPQPQPPPPAQSQQQQQQQQQQSLDDPTSKVKMLVPHLREALVNLMKITSHNFAANAAVDNALKSESTSQKLDKNLEEFYSICDQIEVNLRLARQYAIQGAESAHHTPIPVTGIKPEQGLGDTIQTYSQYISTVKTQITCAREIHDALLEGCRKLGNPT